MLTPTKKETVPHGSVEPSSIILVPSSADVQLRILSHFPLANHRSYENINYCPHCFQSRGPTEVRARAEALTSPTELAIYGGGQWPHYTSYQLDELMPNGNYYETEAISVRHGICGDPEQVGAQRGCSVLFVECSTRLFRALFFLPHACFIRFAQWIR